MAPGSAAVAAPAVSLNAARHALLFGNFAIGCGVMVVAGSLNDLTRALNISVAMGGQLIALAAVMMCLGAPLLATLLGSWDRRRLLSLALLWYALGHALSAFAPSYATLLPLRALSVLAAAVFTPQAAAAMSALAAPQERGRAITYIFLGWGVASVLGMPVHSFIGEAWGWRWAFGLVAVLASIGALWVWRAVPVGIRPPVMRLSAWREAFSQPTLMAVVAVTACTSAGQFTLASYLAPYYRQVLGAHAAQISFLFLCFGAFGLTGNVLVSRHIDRLGAPRIVAVLLSLMAGTLLLWPLARTVPLTALVLLPWGLATFASNSAQQARLSHAAPALAPALMALNTSAIYLGQAVGAGGGGALVAARSALGDVGAALYAPLHWLGLGWVLTALLLSRWAQRRMALSARTLPHGAH
jgi:predicted MFS family arabinose efflux permease